MEGKVYCGYLASFLLVSCRLGRIFHKIEIQLTENDVKILSLNNYKHKYDKKNYKQKKSKQIQMPLPKSIKHFVLTALNDTFHVHIPNNLI